MMLKLHVVSFEVVALCCVSGSANILAEHPYTDNTDTVPLQTRLRGAISNMTATSHLCLLICLFVFSQEDCYILFWCFVWFSMTDICTLAVCKIYQNTVSYFLYKSSVGLRIFLELLTKLYNILLHWCYNNAPHSY